MENNIQTTVPDWNKRKPQNTKYRLKVWYNEKNQTITKDGEVREHWFWNGIYLLEKFELSYRQKFTGELQAIWFKLRQMHGRLDRVVIYCHIENSPEIAFEWTKHSGVLVNNTKYSWEEIL